MSQTVTIRAKGLYLTASDFQAPDGAMSQADNVVISRDGIVETRRGMEAKATRALARLFPFKGALVGHDGSSALSYSSDSGATWTDYGAAVTPPAGYPVRALETAASLFLTDQVRPKRIDALAGTPEESGVPGALDVELALSSAGSPTAMPDDSQLAYRIVFGKKDASGRLLVGAPSSRGVIKNSAGGLRDVTVGFSLPRGLDSSHFFQAYRTTSSVNATTDPGDEMGLVYEGPVPQQRTITQLARATNVVTASSSEHGYVVGEVVRIAPGGAVAGAGFAIVAVGSSSKCASSTDGATWTPRTIPAGDYKAVARGTAVFAAVGVNVAATSSDGTTWSSRTIPAGTYNGICWNGSKFVAVGNSLAATSADGITWAARTISARTWFSVVWTGSQFVAVGQGVSGSYASTSPDGVTWTERVISADVRPLSVVWTGSTLIAAGNSGSYDVPRLWTSADGVTWASRTSPTATWIGAASNGTVSVAVGSGTTVYAASSPDGTTWTTRTLAAGTYRSVAWTGAQFVAVGDSVAATSPDGITWTPQTIAAGGYNGVTSGGSGSIPFASGEYVITGVTADTFTYAETGTDGTLVQSQTATPLTGVFTDTVPDGFLGAALYTNENQEGILASNDRPPLARDIATFRGSLFAANLTLPAQGIGYLLAVGGANGLVANDTVTINGVVYTAKAAEAISAREFKAYTAGSISENIRDTALSLVRVVNRSLSSGASLVYLSGPDDPPGQIEFRNTAPSGNLTVTFSRTTAWSPTSINEAPKTFKNGLVWSKQDQPDHFARSLTLSPVLVGSADEEIQRVIPTRSAAFVLKKDGVWRITGEAGSFSVEPFDPTIHVLGAETAVQLDNTIFTLSDQGVVRISDTGVAVVSRPIESAILALLASSMRSTTASRAFGVAYESDRKYLLWLPTLSSDTQGTQAFVFDMFTGAWTRRTDDFAHVMVNPADDRLYGVDGASVWQERKTLDDTDLADRSYAVTISSGAGTLSVTLADATNAAVGDALAQGAVYGVITAKVSNTVTLDRAAALTNAAAVVYKAIPTAIRWAPKFGASPLALSELQEVAVFWDRVYFSAATLGFSSNVSPAETTLTLRGSDYAWTGAPVEQAEIRAWPPLEKSWGSQFNISLSHAQAWSPNAVSGLALTFKSRSGAISR